RLAQRNWQGGGVAPALVSLSYCDCGQLVGIDRYSDVAGTNLVSSSTYVHDAAGRVTQLKYVNAANAVIAQYAYLYYPAGQAVEQTDHGQTTTYAYDADGQLTSAAGSTGESYEYDDNGNRVSSAAGNYITGPNNQILSDGTSNYQYDAAGNLIQKVVIATG